MSILTRFFGKKEDSESSSLVANPAIQHPLSLQILFADRYRLESDAVTAALRTYHPSMAEAVCEIDPNLAAEGKTIGLLGWGRHVIRCAGFDLPMPAESVENCVEPAHYPQELKARARAHQAHLLLFYAGYEMSPLEQFVALAAVAGVLASFGALVVLNESACTSFPAAALQAGVADDMMDALRTLPLPILYCGFAKYEVQDTAGVWMRTHGAGKFGLPDFAAHAAGHHEGKRYFELFSTIFHYLLSTGKEMSSGHTMQVGETEFLRLRSATAQEAFLAGDGNLLVAEIIGPDQINRRS
jgi:hypothetical protein